MILCSAEPRIISCLPTHVINLVINDNSLEILYIYSVRKQYFCILRFTYLPINVTLIAKMASFGQMQCNVMPLNVN